MEGSVNDIKFVTDSVERREGIVGIEVEVDFTRNRLRCIIAQPWDTHIQSGRQFNLNERPILFFKIGNEAILIIDRRSIEGRLQIVIAQTDIAVPVLELEGKAHIHPIIRFVNRL